MSKNGVNIPITTTADTSGIKRTEDALDDLKTTTEETGKNTKRTAEEFAAAGDKAKVSSWGFYNLDEALQGSSKQSAALTENVKKVTASSVSMRMGVQNASFQLADFAVQVGGGVSATRALSQQLPQLLGGFGMWGAVAGAAVAVVGGLFETMTSGSMTAEEKARKLKETLEGAIGAFKGITTENLEKAEKQLEAQKARVEATRQTWEETNKAQNDYASSALANSGKMAQAQQTIAEWLGQQVAAYEYLKAEMERQAQIRAAQAEKDLAMEAKRLEAAQRTFEETQKTFDKRSELTEKAQQDLLTAEKELEALRAKKKELEDIARDVGNKVIQDDPGLDLLRAVGFQGKAFGGSPEQKKAQKQLGMIDFQFELQAKEQEVDELREYIKKTIADGGTLDRARTAMLAASTRLDDVEKSVEIGTQNILESLAVDQTVAKINDAVTTGKQFATDIDKALALVKPANEAARQNLAGLSGLTADGQIVATEQREAQERLRTLVGQIQSGQASFSGNIGTLIGLMGTYQKDMAAMTTAVQKLQSQYRSVADRLNQSR